MTPFVNSITDLFSYGTVLLDILAAALFIVLISPLKRMRPMSTFADFIGERAILLSFIVSFLATTGSLFYSEIAGFAPCVLCWWQRLFLYPQTILLFTALFKKDEGIRIHSTILSIFGALIALYHTFVQFGWETSLPCPATGPSCAALYFLKFGYVTIPTMSLTIFGILLLFMLAPNPKKRDIHEL